MRKARIAICICDSEYGERFVSCLMKHYQKRLELHVFGSIEQFTQARKVPFEVCLLADCENDLSKVLENCTEPVLYLYDSEETKLDLQEYEKGENVYFVEKYQEVNKIVDEVLLHISDEVRTVQETGSVMGNTKMVAVYSLSENECQLPFSVTFGSILGEQERVLLIDLQENSGFSQVIEQQGVLGLEELLVMAESGSYSKSRIASCIGHAHGMDFIYPVENTECLCEAQAGAYMTMFSMIASELAYDTVILNLGLRFQGFTEILSQCSQIYLMQRKGGMAQWREYEFLEELNKKGYGDITDKIVKVEIPLMNYPVVSFERVVEQWKWNELGDMIRKMMPHSALG